MEIIAERDVSLFILDLNRHTETGMQVMGGRDAAAAGIGYGVLSDAAEPLI